MPWDIVQSNNKVNFSSGQNKGCSHGYTAKLDNYIRGDSNFKNYSLTKANYINRSSKSKV